MAPILDAIIEHYHRVLCESPVAQQHLAERGITNPELIKTFRVGYADGTLLSKVPDAGELHDQLKTLGVLTKRGGEALADCIVVPLPDPLTGEWAALYGRNIETGRDFYVPAVSNAVLNFQAARASAEIILTGSVLDTIALFQVGVRNAIPLHGASGPTDAHLDLFKREGVRTATLLAPAGKSWLTAKARLEEALTRAGLAFRAASLPSNCEDIVSVLRTHGPTAESVLRECLAVSGAESPPKGPPPAPTIQPMAADANGRLQIQRGDVAYVVQPYPIALGRLRAMVRAERQGVLHLGTIDLYASRARSEFARRVAQIMGIDASIIDADLVAVLVECERFLDAEKGGRGPEPAPMTDAERDEALAFLRRPDLLDQVADDMDVLGYVGEDLNKRLLYLVSVSRKLPSPLSAVILSQSSAGKSGLSDVIERLTPEEDVLFLTRLSPQSLFYSAPELLDQKLIIIEERAGSAEVDYPVRAIQSRGRLTVATPSKDPESGETKTRTFCVRAQVAFIESTTDTDINPENGSRCFEISMDESQDQTRRIHDRQRLMRTEAGLEYRRRAKTITQRHWNAQRLLAPMPVLIPYAGTLTFPTAWMRTRRDNARFLNLIEVSAFLHQHQRERRNGSIVATVEDYRIAYELSASVLADTLSDLKRPLRHALDSIRTLAGEEGFASRRQIRDALQLPDTTVRRWLKELVALEYVRAEKVYIGAGKSTVYQVNGPARYDGVPGLLTPDALVARLSASTPPTRQTPPKPRGGAQDTEK